MAVPSQRSLRNPHTQAAASRATNSAEHHIFLASRLTDRDRWLAAMTYEHRVMTTAQLVRLAFPSERSARARLRELVAWSVLDRFRPLRAYGTAAMHYVLGPAGATVLAHQHGLDPKTLGYRRDRALGIANSLRLAHQLGVNDLLTTLAAEQPLSVWWSETRCARHIGDLARPDAFLQLHTPDSKYGFFLEYDTGTEPLARLAGKLPGYHDLARSTAHTVPMLFWLPSPRREASARRALHDARSRLDRPSLVPIATANPQPVSDPAGSVWLPVEDNPGPRRALAALPAVWPQLSTPPDLDADHVLAPSRHGEMLPAPVPRAPLPHRR